MSGLPRRRRLIRALEMVRSIRARQWIKACCDTCSRSQTPPPACMAAGQGADDEQKRAGRRIEIPETQKAGWKMLHLPMCKKRGRGRWSLMRLNQRARQSILRKREGRGRKRMKAGLVRAQVEREGVQGEVGRGRTGLSWSSGSGGSIELYSHRLSRGARRTQASGGTSPGRVGARCAQRRRRSVSTTRVSCGKIHRRARSSDSV